MTVNINDDLFLAEMLKFAETKVASPALASMVQQLIRNICSNGSYKAVNREDLDDAAGNAMLNFLKYGHNFKMKPNYTKKVAIGYVDFGCKRIINDSIKKAKKHNLQSLHCGDDCDIDIAYWDKGFDDIRFISESETE